jgi:hypothetical protein
MGLDGPPTWKMKKLPKETFENLLGGISASARFVFQRQGILENKLTNCVGMMTSLLLART